MKKLLSILLLLPLIAAANPPSAAQIKSEVQALWNDNEIQDLGTYLTTLYTSNSDYVPAILCSSFHDAVFLGKLPSAKAKLVSIQNDAASYPSKYSTEFIQALNAMLKQLDFEIAMHTRKGTSDAQLEASASASAVRSAWGTEPFQYIEIIDLPGNVSLGQ